ncbi:MAG: FHIPEP family type III secretion protein [Oscillospiraceae bacterium]|nr:FHIPEP family type III secretion protein [Oscillospiraceae bacterium]
MGPQMQTVSEVSKNLGISTRMLRYYEQIGLIESSRKENYSYRVYDDSAVKRLRQIILLRKLRIPVKQIKDILENQEVTAAIIEVFRQNINGLNAEISDLSVIRDVLSGFVGLLEKKTDIKLTFDLLNDESVSNIAASLKLPKNHIKEEGKPIMEKIIKPEEIEIHPVEIQVGYGLIPLIDEKQGSNFPDRIRGLKQKIASDIGVVIDYMAIMDNINLSPQSYIVKIKGKQAAAGEIMPAHYLICEGEENFIGRFAEIDGTETTEPAFGLPAKWIAPSDVEKAKALGYFVIDPLSVVITHINEIIKARAHEF